MKISDPMIQARLAKRALPILVRLAEDKKTITYGQLARKLGIHYRHVRWIAGYVRDDICGPRRLPPLNSLIVKRASGLPGDSYIRRGTHGWSKRQKRERFEREREKVFRYPHWREKLEELKAGRDEFDERRQAFLTEADFDNCVQQKQRLRQLRQAFKRLGEAVVAEAEPRLRSLAMSSKSNYVSRIREQGGCSYRDHMWMGFAHRKFMDPRTGVQFQFGINSERVAFNGIWIDGWPEALAARRHAQRHLRDNFDKFRRMLRKLPRDYYLGLYDRKTRTAIFEWSVTEVRNSTERLETFLAKMWDRDVHVSIAEDLSKRNAIALGDRLPSQIASNFARLLPLYSLMMGKMGHSSRTEKLQKVPERSIKSAEKTIIKALSKPFEAFDTKQKRLSDVQRIARDEAFRRQVVALYNGACGVCASRWIVKGKYEVEAAHIIPVTENGKNDPRNGIALCRFHHWAFDNGIFSLRDDFAVIMSPRTRKFSTKPEALTFFASKRLNLPRRDEARPALEAMKWHRENRFLS